MEVGALGNLNPQTRDVEARCLEAFDAARDRIHKTARKVYSRARKTPTFCDGRGGFMGER